MVREANSLSKEERHLLERADELQAELERAIAYHGRWAHFNERLAVVLLVIAITASTLAGIGGVILQLDVRIIGTIASLPALIALAVAGFKFENHADWHHRRRNALRALRRRLRYEIGSQLTLLDITAISQEWGELDARDQKERVDALSLAWPSSAKNVGNSAPRHDSRQNP